MRIVKILTVLMVFTVLVAPAGLAQEDDEREIETDTGVEREIDIEVDGEEVKIESSRETESGENETEESFEVEFSVEEAPRIEISRESEVETSATESENESSMEVRFQSIVEFNDSNGNGVYDSGEEVERYELDEVDYSIDNSERTVDGNTVHVIESSSNDGVFTVRLYATGSFTELGSEQVSPNEVKIDLEIHDYAYKANDTKLALETEISSEKEYEFETESGDEDEKSVEVESSGSQTFFSWKNQAEVDGETTTVGSSEMEDEDEKTVYLSYERGEDIVHDPKLGIKESIEKTGFLQRIISSLLAALGL